jgi:hypothetical protein
MRTDELSGIRVLHLDAEGDPISTPDDAADLVGSAWSHRATMVAIPLARLDPKFFNLRSGVAGEITQKLVNYRLQLAVLGDLSPQLEKSSALRDWVRESNAGDHIWFLDDALALEDKLARRAARTTAR